MSCLHYIPCQNSTSFYIIPALPVYGLPPYDVMGPYDVIVRYCWRDTTTNPGLICVTYMRSPQPPVCRDLLNGLSMEPYNPRSFVMFWRSIRALRACDADTMVIVIGAEVFVHLSTSISSQWITRHECLRGGPLEGTVPSRGPGFCPWRP